MSCGSEPGTCFIMIRVHLFFWCTLFRSPGATQMISFSLPMAPFTGYQAAAVSSSSAQMLQCTPTPTPMSANHHVLPMALMTAYGEYPVAPLSAQMGAYTPMSANRHVLPMAQMTACGEYPVIPSSAPMGAYTPVPTLMSANLDSGFSEY